MAEVKPPRPAPATKLNCRCQSWAAPSQPLISHATACCQNAIAWQLVWQCSFLLPNASLQRLLRIYSM